MIEARGGRTGGEMRHGHLAVGHPLGESSRRTNILSGRDMQLRTQEERREDCPQIVRSVERSRPTHCHAGSGRARYR